MERLHGEENGTASPSKAFNISMEATWEMRILANSFDMNQCARDDMCLSVLARILSGYNSEMESDAMAEKVFVSVFHGVFLVFGLLGNLLVITTVALGAKPRTLTGVDVINPCLMTLAVADLLIILFVIPIRV